MADHHQHRHPRSPARDGLLVFQRCSWEASNDAMTGFHKLSNRLTDCLIYVNAIPDQRQGSIREICHGSSGVPARQINLKMPPKARGDGLLSIAARHGEGWECYEWERTYANRPWRPLSRHGEK